MLTVKTEENGLGERDRRFLRDRVPLLRLTARSVHPLRDYSCNNGTVSVHTVRGRESTERFPAVARKAACTVFKTAPTRDRAGSILRESRSIKSPTNSVADKRETLEYPWSKCLDPMNGTMKPALIKNPRYFVRRSARP